MSWTTFIFNDEAAIVLVLLGVFYLSKPIRLYSGRRLDNNQGNERTSQLWALLSWLLIFAVSTALLLWANLHYPAIGEVFVRLFYVQLVLIAVALWWRFLNRHAVPLGEQIWGKRVISFDLLAGLSKLISLFLAVFAILTIFRLSFNNDMLESGTAGLLTGVVSATVFAPYLKKFMNVASLMVTKPYADITKGDYVEINGKTGTYDHATLHATILKAPDGQEIPIDNSEITHGNINNYSTRTHLRRSWEFHLDVGNRSERLEQVEKLIRNVICDDADCDLVSSKYIDGTRGHHVLQLIFDVQIDPQKIALVNERANDVYRDCLAAIEAAGATLYRPVH